VLKVDEFKAFDLHSPDEFGIKFALFALGKNKTNIARMITGFKPLRTPTKLFKNAAELILVPLSPLVSGETTKMTEMITQARQAATQTVVSVMELGPAMNVQPVRRPATHQEMRLSGPRSLHSNQPSSVKEGFSRAGQVFKQDMNTIIAFVTGDERNIDIFDLPVMVLRPFTAPVSEILNGMCNQIDHQRYERLKDKYG